ncbi:hypothetical protein B0H13DRAFT_1917773 [Mycena leptocephala]|nr:hypothetical protein B0H13DRAFT_1917773 [Mycena leptocephala]
MSLKGKGSETGGSILEFPDRRGYLAPVSVGSKRPNPEVTPSYPTGLNRKEVIRAYQQLKDQVEIRRCPFDASSGNACKMRLAAKPKTNAKRKAVDKPPRRPKAKKSKTNVPAPVGTTWDSVNYSCAFDF